MIKGFICPYFSTPFWFLLTLPAIPAALFLEPWSPTSSNGFLSLPISAHRASASSQWECAAVPGEDSRASPLSPTSQVKRNLHTLPHRPKPGLLWLDLKEKIKPMESQFPWLNFPIKTKQERKREMCPVKEVGTRPWTSSQSTVFPGKEHEVCSFISTIIRTRANWQHSHLSAVQVMNVPQDTERRCLIDNSSNCITLNAGTNNQRNYL